MFDAFAKRLQRLPVLEVADVVRGPSPIALGNAEGALEFGAAPERRGAVDRHAHALRDIAAGTAHRDRRPIRNGADHGVVGADVDRAIVDQKRVRDAGEPLARVVIAIGDRLIREVGRSHNEGPSEVAEQDVLKRRVREHHAEVAGMGGNCVSDWHVFTTAGDDDGAFSSEEELFLGGRELCEIARFLESRSPSTRTASPHGACAT